MTIIDAHSHLWLRQDAVVDGQPIRALPDGRALFFGEERQMLPPFLIDGRNSAEVFLSNMNYAQVGAAVVVQEIIDGNQDDYLRQVQQRWPDRFFCCAMMDIDRGGLTVPEGFRGAAIPGHRMRRDLDSPEMMAAFKELERRGIILSMCLGDDADQIARFATVIQECPRLKVAVGHFGLARSKHWLAQVRLARAEGQEKVRGLLRKYHGLKNDVIPRWDITLMNDMYAFLFTALSGKKNREQLSNLSNLASMEPAKAMNALAETARAKGMDSDEYRTQKDRFLSDYGDRCLGELKLETRTYRTNPELVDLYVERLSEPANTPSAAPSQNAVPSRTLNPFVRRARVGIRNREISRLNRTRLYGFARTIFTEIGNALYDMDLLDDPLDVFYLYIPELETYASWDRKEGADFRRRVDERKKQYEQFAELPPYTRLVYDGQIHQKQTHGLQTDRPAAPGLMTGTGVSHGTAVGEAFVVEQPDLSMDTTGKILVTHSTDPGWVFLIQNAAGIVAEKGSLLSHTAIITRELGKPAVVGVKDATRLIQTGDTVVVDADAGTVRLSETAERGGAR